MFNFKFLVMKFFNSKKKVVLSAVAVLFISVAAFAGDGTKEDDTPILGRRFWGSECTIEGYRETCCSYRFWINVGCGEPHPAP
jgi:hypothetical protein